ncbi:MAG: hypothetical protein ACRETQ_04335 [Gammaproteobacteria bacterium]
MPDSACVPSLNSENEVDELLNDVVPRVLAYLRELAGRLMRSDLQAVAKLAALNDSLTEDSPRPEAILKGLDEACADAWLRRRRSSLPRWATGIPAPSIRYAKSASCHASLPQGDRR